MGLSIDTILGKLRKIQDRELFTHSKATSRMAVRLAENLVKNKPSLRIDINKVEIASLLHDWAKGFSEEKLLDLTEKYNIEAGDFELKNTYLLHGFVGAAVIENELGIRDKSILSAVKYHTTGRNNMSIFDKIIFVADHIEDNRDYRMVDEIRSIAFDDFDQAVIMVIENKIFYVLKKRLLLHPKTISFWNAAVKELRR
ncbi:MAG: bis(5'-nucleosyl)-tetraphosphatase (symmetrical) YqeK [bacterium]